MIAKFKKIREGAVLPYKAHESDAGFDVTCLVDTVITPNGRSLIQTGLEMEIPEGYECQVRSRSGLALKDGIMVLNSPGTIDCNYRGEIGVILFNSSRDKVTIKAGTRVAQLVFNKLPDVDIVEVKEISDTDRGQGGFGSSDLVDRPFDPTNPSKHIAFYKDVQVYPKSQDENLNGEI